jgi:hypothetical protein
MVKMLCKLDELILTLSSPTASRSDRCGRENQRKVVGGRDKSHCRRKIALLSPEEDATKAETHFQRALAVARQQQAKSWSPLLEAWYFLSPATAPIRVGVRALASSGHSLAPGRRVLSMTSLG